MREKVLDAAGLSSNSLADLLAQSVSVMQKHLGAKRVVRTTHKGEVIETHFDEDTAIQLKAAEALASFAVQVAGLRKKDNESQNKGPVAIQINLGKDQVKTEP